MEVLVSPTGTQVLVANTDCVAKADASTGPLCYDYNEQFDREALCNQDIPLGFVHRIKAILEERTTVEQASMKVEVDVIQDIAELPASEVAELPASPVPKRITRGLILAAIDPTSSTGETIASVEVKTSNKTAGALWPTLLMTISNPAVCLMKSRYLLPPKVQTNVKVRYLMLHQATRP